MPAAPIGSKRPHQVSVRGQFWEVTVHRKSSVLSIATGKYQDHLLEAEGRDDVAALSSWQGKARALKASSNREPGL